MRFSKFGVLLSHGNQRLVVLVEYVNLGFCKVLLTAAAYRHSLMRGHEHIKRIRSRVMRQEFLFTPRAFGNPVEKNNPAGVGPQLLQEHREVRTTTSTAGLSFLRSITLRSL
jgi:hypothetical protein